jgi:hypothetical protein
MDDRELDMPLALVALKEDYLPSIALDFQQSLAKSALWVLQNPKEAISDMESLGLIPPSIFDIYELPAFDLKKIPRDLPDSELFKRYVGYFKKNGALSKEPGDGLREPPSFEDVVYQPSVN